MSAKKINESVSQDDLYRFEEIMQEVVELVEEAYMITRKASDGMIAQRAESYWRGHIQGAVGQSYSEYLGGSMTSMEETLEELKDLISDGNEDADDDEYMEDDEDMENEDDEDMDEKKALEKKTPVVESSNDLYDTLAEHLDY